MNRKPICNLGLIAEFDDGERLVEAVRKARAAGFSRLDSYSPYPLEGMPEALGFHDRRLALLTLAGGIFGAAFGYGMQVFAIGDFPIDIGVTAAWQSFLMVSFELATLAVLAAVFGMLVPHPPAAPAPSCFRRAGLRACQCRSFLPDHLWR